MLKIQAAFEIRNIVTGQSVQSVTVIDSITVVAANNQARGAIFIVNVSTNDCWLGVDVGPVVDKGIFLGKNGGSFVLDATAISLGQISGICKAGQSALLELQEFNV